MEAKGCAKPALWKNARRYFYWAVRARVARSAALADLADASPGTSFKHRSQLLDDLASIEPGMDYRQMSEALEKLDLNRTLAQLKADHLMHQLVDLTKQDHKAAMESFLRMADHLSDEDKTSLIGALQGPRSSGMFIS